MSATPSELHSPDDWEVAPGFEHQQLQGSVPSLASEDELRNALEQAFDYRGDVTVTRRDGAVVEGYLYDRRQGSTLADSLVRILPSNGSPRVSIPFNDVAALVFSGRDTAAGKSWEAWVRKYWEKRAANTPAALEPEPLD
jgi:hypothetical protein